jgi:hypothetical protein
MNTKQKISFTTLSVISLAASYWTGYVHGSSHLTSQEVVISIALPVILILTLGKLTFAWFFKRNNPPPLGGGLRPWRGLDVPAPKPPGGPPEIYCEHAA